MASSSTSPSTATTTTTTTTVSAPTTKTSEIIRTTDAITVKIFNLSDISKIAQDVLSDPAALKLIRGIYIEIPCEEDDDDDDDDDDEEIDIQLVENLAAGVNLEDLVGNQDGDEDAEGDSEDYKAISGGENDEDEDEDEDENEHDEEMTTACGPLIALLDAILEASGSLKTFTWDAQSKFWSGENTSRRRPNEFWQALWKHGNTLRSLRIGFYTHELHKVTGPSGSQLFPALRELYVDAGTAHGDDGSAVESLLSLCPGLETLDFSWPGCDLDNCQIQNVSWDYSFPNLRSLTLYGSDFSPASLAAFLERHPSIETFVDGVDGDCRELYNSVKGPRLAATALPNVKAVNRADSSPRYPEDWYADAAGRKIGHMSIPWGWMGGFEVSPTAARELKCLELNENVMAWRPKEVDSDDEEEERKKIEADPERELVKSMRGVLPQLNALQELGIRLESDCITMRLPDGTHGSPPGMDEKDLKIVLSILPASSSTSIRALRLWDSKGKPLPQSLLDDFPPIPASLEYLGWEAEEKVLYRLVRHGSGKVKAVACESLRVVEVGREKDWDQKRILEY